jgi:hypothetical protein
MLPGRSEMLVRRVVWWMGLRPDRFPALSFHIPHALASALRESASHAPAPVELRGPADVQ